jgi:Peptidase family S41
MNKIILFLILINFQFVFAQTEVLSKEKLNEDLTIFKQIREKANSGLYKYKTKTQIDSIYKVAENEIQKPLTIISFYKLICQLTDFEGSTHNETILPLETLKSFEATDGYFPLPLKIIKNELLINTSNAEIPLASKILKINDLDINQIYQKIRKYYTTDGNNISGKSIGINSSFAKYYKYEFGPSETFRIEYLEPFKAEIKTKIIESVSNKIRLANFLNRHSKMVDSLNYFHFSKENKYKFEFKSKDIAVLTVNSFNIGGNKNAREHKIYKKNLQKWFQEMEKLKTQNLIIDVRFNGGGTDPNDVLLFSFLANQKFRENKSAFINTVKIHFSEYLIIDEKNTKISERSKKRFEKELATEFDIYKDGKYFQNERYNAFIEPKANAFKGQIYLLISERVASAGALFASLVASNTNSITIGNETMGGYFGHNGHTPVAYQLPNSKIITGFSIVNLEQDVIEKKNQKFGRGIIPDIYKTQTLSEFIKNQDNIIEFTINTIEKN